MRNYEWKKVGSQSQTEMGTGIVVCIYTIKLLERQAEGNSIAI